MMKYFFILFTTILIGCESPKTDTSRVETVAVDSTIVKADSYLSKLTSLKKFNGVVLLKKNEKIILNKAYNISSDSSSTLFVLANSQFDLRSVSKLFAKASLINLEEEGKLSMETTLDSFIPGFPRVDEITIHHLMHHSSGLPREFSDPSLKTIDMNAADIILQAEKETLEFEPGAKSQYSNVGYQLLYYIIGKAHESSFVNYLRDTFFTPLDMADSGSNFDDPKGRKTDYAYGHFIKEKDSILCVCSSPDDEMRMGNLYATTRDMASFLSSLDSIKHKELMVAGTISHAGGTQGKRAYVERNFTKNYSIVFLANYDAIPFELLVNDLQRLIMNEEVEMPREINRTTTKVEPSILKQYEGTYDLPDAGHLKLTIKVENDSLFLYQKGKNNGVLYPESDSVFFGDPSSEESIEFAKDSLGNYYMLLDFQGVQWKGLRVSE
jgi:hypothetical protein